MGLGTLAPPQACYLLAAAFQPPGQILVLSLQLPLLLLPFSAASEQSSHFPSLQVEAPSAKLGLY